MKTSPLICDEYKYFESVIIFGASLLGASAFAAVKNSIRVVAFSDNDQKKHGGEYCGVTIISPSDITRVIDENGKCAILIASMYYGAISFQLSEMGVSDFFVFSSMTSGIKDAANDYTIRNPLNISVYKKLLESDIAVSLHDLTPFAEEEYELPPVFVSGEKVKYSDDKNKNILIIAYEFPPLGGSGVQRSSKFVKYLKRYGYNPIVLTSGATAYLAHIANDGSLLADIPQETTVIRVDDPYIRDDNLTENEAFRAFCVLSGIIENNALANAFLTDMSRYNSANHRTWNFFTPWASNALRAISKILDFNRIGTVYSTADPYSDHYIAFYIKKKYKIPWIADFRDEWTNNPLQKPSDVSEIEKALESKIAHEADALVATTVTAASNFASICKIPKEKTYCITNGYDEDDFVIAESEKTPRDNCDKFTVKYSGTIYIDYDPIGVMIEAVNELIESGDLNKNKISVMFNGINGARSEDIIKERYDRLNIIEISPYLQHIENIKNMQSADLLLLFGHGAAVLPGKVFEYIRMGVPIIAVDFENGLIKGVLEETRTGVCFTPSEKEGMKAAFKKAYDEYFKGALKIEPDRTVIEKYSRKSTTKSLVKIIEKIGRGV